MALVKIGKLFVRLEKLVDLLFKPTSLRPCLLSELCFLFFTKTPPDFMFVCHFIVFLSTLPADKSFQGWMRRTGFPTSEVSTCYVATSERIKWKEFIPNLTAVLLCQGRRKSTEYAPLPGWDWLLVKLA